MPGLINSVDDRWIGILSKLPAVSMCRLMIVVMCLLTTIVLSCGVSLADDYFELKSFRWSADADPGLHINVTNEMGDVRIRNSKRGGFGVSAMIQSLEENQTDPTIEIQANPDAPSYRVSVGSEFNGRVDLTLLIPDGSSVNSNTTFGNLYCRINGDVDARTITGDLTITSTGSVNGSTTTGSVKVWVNATDWIGSHKIRTTSGDITFKVLNANTFRLQVVTEGKIALYRHLDSDQPIYATRERFSLRQGSDENGVEIDSENGRVNIYATQLLEAEVSDRGFRTFDT